MASVILVDLIGQLKMATLVVGAIDLGLTASAYLHTSSEEYFLAIVCIALLVSLIFVLLIIAGKIPVTNVYKKIDMIYHALMALLILVGCVTMMISVFRYWNLKGSGGWGWGHGRRASRVFALIFGVLNSCIYAYISHAIYKAPSI